MKKFPRSIFTLKSGILLFLVFLTLACQQKTESWTIEAPGEQIRVEIKLTENDEPGKLYYLVSRYIDGTWVEIMDPSPLGVEREDSHFVSGLRPGSVRISKGLNENYTLVSGKKMHCDKSYNEMQLSLKNGEGKIMRMDFRAFEDGIAFRYFFPEQENSTVFITRELTGFNFKEGKIWAHPYDTLTKWNPAYETYYRGPIAIGTSAPWNKNGWAFPLLLESADSWMMVSEAGFDDSYGASHIQADCTDGLYELRFAEQGEAEGFYKNSSRLKLPMGTPWRFIVVGDSPAAAVETSLPTDLSAPSQLKDISWIKPGRASWSWWSDSDSPQDYNRLLPFIDLASEMGWEYSLVDANWDRMKNGDIKELVKYADSKNVGLLVWYNSGGKHNVVEEAPRDLMDDPIARRSEFEKISKMGIRGIKVDFFQSDKQEIIGQYIGILKDAAEFNLLVNFHGCTLPKGWRRTWPNLLTMESVRGAECYKFAPEYPAEAPSHTTILPFTRNAVGPCDYTTGGFSNSNYPHLTSYGFELALPVILESGIMHHLDTPEQTLGLPPYAIQFLKDIPVTWDDTRYLAGYPGKEVVLARKKGDRWYIGGINGEAEAKELSIDLSACGISPELIELIVDGKGARDLQSSIVRLEDGRFTIRLQPYGGFAGSW